METSKLNIIVMPVLFIFFYLTLLQDTFGFYELVRSVALLPLEDQIYLFLWGILSPNHPKHQSNSSTRKIQPTGTHPVRFPADMNLQELKINHICIH